MIYRPKEESLVKTEFYNENLRAQAVGAVGVGKEEGKKIKMEERVMRCDAMRCACLSTQPKKQQAKKKQVAGTCSAKTQEKKSIHAFASPNCRDRTGRDKNRSNATMQRPNALGLQLCAVQDMNCARRTERETAKVGRVD